MSRLEAIHSAAFDEARAVEIDLYHPAVLRFELLDAVLRAFAAGTPKDEIIAAVEVVLEAAENEEQADG